MMAESRLEADPAGEAVPITVAQRRRNDLLRFRAGAAQRR
jgi:hypothetical protein